MHHKRTLRSDAGYVWGVVRSMFEPVAADDGPLGRAVSQRKTTSVGRPLSRISIAVLLVGATLTGLVATGVMPMAGAGTANVHSAPEWFPLRGSAGAQWKVGCTYHSANSASFACDGYHPIWALDLFQYAGAPVYASGAGFATRQSGGGYGNYVVVDHGSSGLSLYGHLSSYNIPPEGAWVDQNDVIGGMGNSGVPDGSVHLHYERKAGGPANSGWYTANSLDPGPLKACHDSSPVTYPQAWGLSTWEGIGWGTVAGYSDGTMCSGATSSSSTSTTTTIVVHNPEGRLESATRLDGGRVRLIGWASDADTTGPVAVQGLIDGNSAGQSATNPGSHRFDFTVQADWRSHTACVKALDVGGGVNVVLEGCAPIPFALCPDTAPTIVSSKPNDQILATASDDVIWATGGDAQIAAGQGGNDVICGGGATGSPGGNHIVGGPGTNLIFTGPGNNDVVAGPGHTQVISGGGHNRIAVCPNTVVLNRGPQDEIQPGSYCGPTTSSVLESTKATSAPPTPSTLPPSVNATGPTFDTVPVPVTLPAVPTATDIPPTTVMAAGPTRCGGDSTQTSHLYNVRGAGPDGVAVRSGPSPLLPARYTAADGDSVAVVCYMDGVVVGGSTRWDRLSNGLWVADAYLSTPKA